jgi:hypothetical protein
VGFNRAAGPSRRAALMCRGGPALPRHAARGPALGHLHWQICETSSEATCTQPGAAALGRPARSCCLLLPPQRAHVMLRGGGGRCSSGPGCLAGGRPLRRLLAVRVAAVCTRTALQEMQRPRSNCRSVGAASRCSRGELPAGGSRLLTYRHWRPASSSQPAGISALRSAQPVSWPAAYALVSRRAQAVPRPAAACAGWPRAQLVPLPQGSAAVWLPLPWCAACLLTDGGPNAY